MKPQFIIELKKLRKTPCEDYLQHFVDGKADALELFKLEGQQYGWLYANSDYDIIGYEIEHWIFDWEEYSWAVAKYCPQHFDPKSFNWFDYSGYVAQFCPEHFDTEKYNWKDDSSYVAEFCPQHLDPEKFNWKQYSYYVAKYCPQHLDPKKYNWEKHSNYVAKFCPHLLHLKP